MLKVRGIAARDTPQIGPKPRRMASDTLRVLVASHDEPMPQVDHIAERLLDAADWLARR